ncbi:IclR family transcriptional regulator [Bordetella petrii]|uniref:IclR family transcriptional regulator n=1 Tax=Bordetella petrii TaxID=94624 RepID=UPI003732AE14
MATTDYEVPAIRRAHDILRALAAQREPLRAADLARACAMPRSSLYLLLDSLVQRRWVDRAGDGYVIGLELMALGAAYLRHDGLQAAFRAAAAEFVERHNEVMQLAVLDGAEVVYLAREDARRPVRLVSELGSHLPAHACALGKALLASLPDDTLAGALPARLAAVSERTQTDREALLRELAQVRADGLAYDREEVAAGLYCYAACVGETALGKRVAVSASVPADRLDTAHVQAVTQGVRRAARAIAARVALAPEAR